MHTLTLVAALLTGCWTATTLPPAAPAPAAPPTGTPPPPAGLPVHDHRFESAVRLGVMGGGEVTPVGSPRGKTDTTAIFGAELNYLVHPYFTVGGFLGGLSAPFHHESSGERIGDGSLLIVTLGATLKAHFDVGPKTVMRVGMLVGRNELRASGDIRGSGYDASGSGFNVAPTLELAYRVSPRYALSVQASFLSQPSGSMTIDGDTDDLAFKPLYYLAVGGELFH